MAATPKPRVLCVDDEPNVLEGLKLHLERRYDVQTANSGAAGLALLASEGPFAVVVSDMRMPQMNGAEFLTKVRTSHPNTVRVLLTGQTDLESAVRAINEGQLFRFLTKPCPPAQLLATMEAAVEQHRLLTAERELLEQTLLGSVRVLNEVLALAHPEAFGRAIRIKQYASELADACQLENRWELDSAVILSQLGCVTLDRGVLERVQQRKPLSAEDTKALARVPELSSQLISHIPRLEGVREMIRLLSRSSAASPSAGPLNRGAEVLRIAAEFEWLETSGAVLGEALTTMRESERFDPELLLTFSRIRTRTKGEDTIKQLSLSELREGMILAEDVRTAAGVMFAARGYVVTAAFVERARNFRAAGVPGVLKCIVPAELAAADGPDELPRAA